MPSLTEYLPWLRRELDLAQIAADVADEQEKMSSVERVSNFQGLIAEIESIQADGVELVDSSAGSGGLMALLKNPGVLAMQVLEGLPPELREQVRIGDTEKFEASVLKLLRGANGQPMLLDNILIGLFLQDGEKYKRQQLNNTLYRMVQKGQIESVPGKKGLYVAKTADVVESGKSGSS